MNTLEYLKYKNGLVKQAKDFAPFESAGMGGFDPSETGYWLQETQSPSSTGISPGLFGNTAVYSPDPILNSKLIADAKLRSKGKGRNRGWWAMANAFVPGASDLSTLLNESDTMQAAKDNISEIYGRYPKLVGDIHALQEDIFPKYFDIKKIEHGLPAAGGFGGAAFGLGTSIYANKKYNEEADEYERLVNSPEFQELPPDVQKKVLKMRGLKKKKRRGAVNQTLRNIGSAAGYGALGRYLAQLASKKITKKKKRALDAYITDNDDYRKSVDRIGKSVNKAWKTWNEELAKKLKAGTTK